MLWHMEVDLKIHSKLNKKQFGFTKGASTETALHKIVHKIERTTIHSGMALDIFLGGVISLFLWNLVIIMINKFIRSSLPNFCNS